MVRLLLSFFVGLLHTSEDVSSIQNGKANRLQYLEKQGTLHAILEYYTFRAYILLRKDELIDIELFQH